MASKCCSYDDIPLILKVEDLMPILDIGRTAAYALVRSGLIRSVRVGRGLRIPKAELLRFLDSATE